MNGARVTVEVGGRPYAFELGTLAGLSLLGHLSAAAARPSGRVRRLEPASATPCCYGLGHPHRDPQTGVLFFTACPTCGAHYTGDRRPANPATCPDCKGSGRLWTDRIGRGDLEPEPCGRCAQAVG